MPTLKAYRHYQLKDKKKSMHIETIIPVSDREVSQAFFDEYEDISGSDAIATMVKFDCVEEV